MKVKCRHCDGTGEIEHDCFDADRFGLVKMLWDTGYDFNGNHESLSIQRCKVCGRLYKVRCQSDAGTGGDDIWLAVGEESRGYSFTAEEAEKYTAKVRPRGEDVRTPPGPCLPGGRWDV